MIIRVETQLTSIVFISSHDTFGK